MPTLNRFPLLGMWAKEAARRIGYREDEAESLGHGYAVLYAIRARRVKQPAGAEGGKQSERPARKAKPKRLSFGGDDLEVTHDAAGHVRARVGGDKPQTPRSYQVSVQGKFPPGYYAKLQRCFRKLFQGYKPKELDSRLIYDLYDDWKKTAGRGRLVDLDELLEWCRENAG